MGPLEFNLTGKVMMVTGAGRGIGRAICLEAARVGADLILVSRTPSELEEVALQIRDLGRGARAISFDVTSLPEIGKGVKEALGVWGRIDVLVNNAGINIPRSALDVTEEDWDVMIDTNLKGLFFCCQAVGRHMVKRKKGKIINIASQLGIVGATRRAPYCASKGGVILLTKALAIEWAPYNINVNAVAPTLIRTPLTEPLIADREFFENFLSTMPLGRVGRPEDVAWAVIYLASDASDLVTGYTLSVDGGWTAQ